MGFHYSEAVRTAIDQDNRMTEEAGVSMSSIIEEIRSLIDASSVGSTATGAEIDAAAKNASLFAKDGDTTNGLTFGFKAGRFMNGNSIIDVSAGTLALTDNTTNYVEVTSAGVVSVNTSGFTTGRLPLYQITTSGGAITANGLVSKRPALTFVFPGAINAERVAGRVKTITITRSLGTISATTEFVLPVLPDFPCTVKKAKLTVNANTTASDTNYWTFALANKGTDATGNTAMLAATDANTTKATGGTAMDQYTPRSLTLHGTGANLETLAGQVLVFTATKTASATNLGDAQITIELEAKD
jgi:hypothetical protein